MTAKDVKWQPRRHGLYSNKSPVGCSYIDKQANQFRKCLEDAVLERYGKIDIANACHVNTAHESLKHAAKAASWLRRGWDDMDWSTRLQFSREVVTALEKRDRAVAKLGLGEETSGKKWYDEPIDLPEDFAVE